MTRLLTILVGNVVLFLGVAAPVFAGSLGIAMTASDLWSGYRQMIVEDSIAYCAAISGLQILHIGDPNHVTEVGRYHLATQGLDLVKRGNYVYFLDASSGQFVFDVSDPTSPFIAATFDESEPVGLALAVTGDRLVLGAVGFLSVYDLSDPAHPNLIDRAAIPSFPRDVVIRDSIVYVPLGDSGIAVAELAGHGFDSVWTISRPYPITAFAIADSVPFFPGAYAYLATGDHGVVVVDPDDHQNLDSIGGFRFSAEIEDLTIVDDILIADGEFVGLMFFGLYDPRSPSWRSSLRELQQFKTIISAGAGSLWVLDELRLTLVDITPIFAPAVVAVALESFDVLDVALGTDDLYVAAGGEGILRMKRSQGNGWERVAQYVNGGEARGVATRGDTVFAAEGAQGFAVIDWSDAHHPVVRAHGPVNDAATDFELSRSRLYVIDEDYGVKLYDIADPFAPRLLGQKRTNRRVTGVWADDATMVIGQLNAPATIYDVTVAVKPRETAVFAGTQFSSCFAFHEDVAYVGDQFHGLMVYDMTYPLFPVLDTAVRPPALVQSLLVSGHYLFVNDAGSGLGLWDIRDPHHPIQVDAVENPGFSRTLVKRGEELFSADQTSMTSYMTTPAFLPGDVDLTETVDLADAIALINHLWRPGPGPPRPNAADVNATGDVDILDLVYLIGYLFRDGEPPIPGTVD